MDCGLGWPGQKARPYLQNNQRKKGWTHGSSRILASHVQSLEFKPQYCLPTPAKKMKNFPMPTVLSVTPES
jgi:hypothetical protein